jgi:hypothetical protein
MGWSSSSVWLGGYSRPTFRHSLQPLAVRKTVTHNADITSAATQQFQSPRSVDRPRIYNYTSPVDQTHVRLSGPQDHVPVPRQLQAPSRPVVQTAQPVPDTQLPEQPQLAQIRAFPQMNASSPIPTPTGMFETQQGTPVFPQIFPPRGDIAGGLLGDGFNGSESLALPQVGVGCSGVAGQTLMR